MGELRITRTFGYQDGNLRAHYAGTQYEIADESGIPRAVVTIRPYSYNHSSDPRTVMWATATRSTVEVKDVFRPPLTREQIAERIIPFAEAAITASTMLNGGVSSEETQ